MKNTRSRVRAATVLAAALLFVPMVSAQEPPAVDSATVWIGEVVRGDFTIQVRGPGVLERFGRGFHAHVRVAAQQAAALELDQPATVDTRNDLLEGRVVHIEDRVHDGTLTVVVAIEGPLPENLRPGLSVDARIETGHLDDVLYVSRPAFAQGGQQTAIFRVNPDSIAERVAVTWGQASVDKIVVAEGLSPGDRIILSDMSRYDAASRVRLVD